MSGSGPGRLLAAVRERLRVAAARLATMPVEGWVTLAVVVVCMAFVVMNVGGALLLRNTTPAGGDMGAHVWGPAYLRDELLPRGRLTGWTMDWYAGFPAYHFYMIVPSLAIALLSLVIPYGVAFKLVAVSGIVTMPASAAFFARSTRLPFPAPALAAVAATAFLFDRSFSIYGGNVASTMAGEFAFSISLSVALVYLGVLARGLRTGRHRGLTAFLLAMVGLCHLIPAFFAIGATVVMVAVHPGSSAPFRRWARVFAAAGGLGGLLLAVSHLKVSVSSLNWDVSIPHDLVVACWALVVVGALGWILLATGAARWLWLATTMPVAGLLGAFWVLPFALRSPYMNDMGWEKKTNYSTFLYDRGTDVAGKKLDSGLVDALPLQWVLGFAAVGVVLALVQRRRAGAFLALTALATAVAFWAVPDGRLWNARLTPFYFLCLYLLGAVGVAEVSRLVAALVASDMARPVRAVRAGVAVVAATALLGVLAMPLHSMPYGEMDGNRYRWGPFSTTDDSFVDSWANWNFKGYEEKAAYPEYRAIVTTMDELGRTNGCGRAMWEHEEQHDRYGTPMALMLLPFWTDGCIGSMEGLFFEASATTPYHFLNQDQLSVGPSNAQRDMPYGPGAPSAEDFDLGIAHLQMLGVRYYMAITPEMQDLAANHPALTQVATSGPWIVYEVSGSELVVPLSGEPVVVEGASEGGHTWQDLAVCWYQDPLGWDVPLADDGPDEWRRVTRTVFPAEEATPAQRCLPEDWGWFGDRPETVPVAQVAVSDIDVDQDRISFSVDQVGSPVLVRTSYFPNWKASGADGPWRVAPNLMVVIPTENDVELTYGWTSLDLAGIGLSALGLVGLVLLWRFGPVSVGRDDSFWARGDGDTNPTTERAVPSPVTGSPAPGQSGASPGPVRTVRVVSPSAAPGGIPDGADEPAGASEEGSWWAAPVGPDEPADDTGTARRADGSQGTDLTEASAEATRSQDVGRLDGPLEGSDGPGSRSTTARRRPAGAPRAPDLIGDLRARFDQALPDGGSGGVEPAGGAAGDVPDEGSSEEST